MRPTSGWSVRRAILRPMTTVQRSSPTVRGMAFAQRLKALRVRANRTVDQAASHMQMTSRSVSRWEAGEAVPHPRDIDSLCDYYEVPEGEEREELKKLAKEAKEPGWWAPYGRGRTVRDSFLSFLGLEAGAEGFGEFTATMIPGLLQTEPYMRAVMSAAEPPLDDATINRRIEVRLRRQEEMKEKKLPCHFIIAEACLRLNVGGTQVMNEQLSHLIEASKPRFITVQILPFKIGAHASILGGFTLLTFGEIPPIACVELLNGDLYADGSDAEQYTKMFNRLREGALPTPHSLDLVSEIREGQFSVTKQGT